MPSRDFTSEDLFSSRMMSMHSSTHSSQMKTVGPAISLRTSCWLLPQNEQYKVFFESPAPTLLILFSVRRFTRFGAVPCAQTNPLKIGANSLPKRGINEMPTRFVVYYISLILTGLPKRPC